MYFDLGQGEDYVYQGKTEIIGIHKADKLKLSTKQKELLGGKTDPSQIYPEYYVIKVNNFDDIAKDTLDQWMYYLKNNEIKDDFNAFNTCDTLIPAISSIIKHKKINVLFKYGSYYMIAGFQHKAIAPKI